MQLFFPLSDKLLFGLVIVWLTYSIVVIFYLSLLNNRYLVPVLRDGIIGNKTLKDHKWLIDYYKDRKVINILVLSGGGVRGKVPLYILSYIEAQTGKKVGELFDFFAGSSTGAIAAAVFAVAGSDGKYKYSAHDILERYNENSSRMFSSPLYHQILTFFGLFAPRFLPDNKMSVLEEYFGKLTIGELQGNILIPVYNIDQHSLQIVKNWDSPHGKSNDNYLVADLINGASSPPMLFPAMACRILGNNHLLIDPAVLLNNPILQVLLYVRALFPDKQLNLVMVGNGSTAAVKYNYRNMFSFGLYGLYQYLFSAPALTSKLYLQFVEEYLKDTARFDRRISYTRINSVPDEELNPTSTSEENMARIGRFATKMLQENMPAINHIIEQLQQNNI